MRRSKTKYIYVFGGVLSGLGKGIVASSLGYLLKSLGYKITIQKLDPYLNVDPGTMNPYQHGEVFVLDDGSETDLDLGHYERFIDVNLSRKNTTSSGRVYWDVLERERKGDYLGQTIQVIPHITDEIKRRIEGVNKNYDVIISEVGGTVGDIEGQPFYEAIRQMILEKGKGNSLVIHTTLLPFINAAGEIKTKPTQHSVMRLREIGIEPDMLVCRTEDGHHLTNKLKTKLGLFCNVTSNHVFESPDVDTIYEIPIVLNKQGFDASVIQLLNLSKRNKHRHLSTLIESINQYKAPKHEITIAMCGKYNGLHDAYKSIIEAFIHSGIKNSAKVYLKWIDSEKLELKRDLDLNSIFKNIDGILIPGGFGDRGIEGKIMSSQFARENKIPFFGICLGLQCAVIDFARNVSNFKNANSTEFNKRTKYPVIDLMPKQKKVKNKGATMRLGSYSCLVNKRTKAFRAYKKELISERHRHRYEVNDKYIKQLVKDGLIVSGKNKKINLVEIIELSNHPWFVGVQFHPELKSRIVKVHPLFREFISAAIKYNNKK